MKGFWFSKKAMCVYKELTKTITLDLMDMKKHRALNQKDIKIFRLRPNIQISSNVQQKWFGYLKLNQTLHRVHIYVPAGID